MVDGWSYSVANPLFADLIIGRMIGGSRNLLVNEEGEYMKKKKIIIVVLSISLAFQSMSYQQPLQSENYSARLRRLKKTLGHEVREYIKCIKGDKSCDAKRKKVLYAGIALVVIIVATGWILATKQSGMEKIINFDRMKIPFTPSGLRVEGYWATSPDFFKDIHKARYPFPQKNDSSWPGQQEFLDKLSRIESEQGKGRIEKKAWRATASKEEDRWRSKFHSRFDEAKELSLGEFFDKNKKVGWTADFGGYYVKEYNVKPSRDFYHYVMEY